MENKQRKIKMVPLGTLNETDEFFTSVTKRHGRVISKHVDSQLVWCELDKSRVTNYHYWPERRSLRMSMLVEVIDKPTKQEPCSWCGTIGQHKCLKAELNG